MPVISPTNSDLPKLRKYNFGLYGWHAIMHPLFGNSPLAKLLLSQINFFDGVCFALLPDGLDQFDIARLIDSRFVHSIRGTKAEEFLHYEDPEVDLAAIILECGSKCNQGAMLFVEDRTTSKEEILKELHENQTVMCRWPDSKFRSNPAYSNRFLGKNVYTMLDSIRDITADEAASFIRSASYTDSNTSILTNCTIDGDNLSELTHADLKKVAKNCILMYTIAFDFESYFVWVRHENYVDTTSVITYEYD